MAPRPAQLLRVAGLTLLHQRQKGARTLLQLWLRAGSASAPSPVVAIAAHRASLHAARAALVGKDARVGGWLTVDHAVFEIDVPAAYTSAAVEALHRLRDAPLPSAALEGERSTPSGALSRLSGDLRDLLSLSLGADHPYVGSTASAEEEVMKAARHHRQERYRGGTLVALGAIDERELIASLRGVFPPSKARDDPWPAAVEAPDGPRFSRVSRPGVAGAELQLAFVDTRASSARDGAALELLARIVDEQVLPQLATRPDVQLGAARAFAYAGQRASLLVVSCRASAGQTEQTLRQLLAGLFARRALSRQTIIRASRAWAVQRALLAQTRSGRARLLAARVEHRIGAIRAQAARQLATYLLRPARLALRVRAATPPASAALRRWVDVADRQLNKALARSAGEQLRLASGARLAIDGRPTDSLVALRLRWLGGGRALESVNTAGAARLIAGQLTRCVPHDALGWRAETIGGDVALAAVGLPGSAAELLRKAAACVWRLPSAGLSRLRLRLLGAHVATTPRARLDGLFVSMLYTDGRGLPTEGTATGLGLSAERLRARARRALTASRLRIAAAGAVERPALIAASYALFGRRATVGRSSPATRALPTSPLEAIDPALSGSLGSVGAAFPSPTAEQRVVLRGIAAWLRSQPIAIGQQSLSLDVRLEVVGGGYLQVTLRTAADKVDAAVAQLHRRLLRIGERGLPLRWLERYRKRRLVAVASQRERVLPRTAALLAALISGETPDAEQRALKELGDPMLRRVARKLLGPRKLVVAIVREDPGTTPAAKGAARRR